MKTARRTRGFTLIELLVVLTLILTLAAVAVAFVPQAAQRSNPDQEENPKSLTQSRERAAIGRITLTFAAITGFPDSGFNNEFGVPASLFGPDLANHYATGLEAELGISVHFNQNSVSAIFFTSGLPVAHYSANAASPTANGTYTLNRIDGDGYPPTVRVN